MTKKEVLKVTAEANIIMIKEAEIGPEIKILEKMKSGAETQITGVIQQHLSRARDAMKKEVEATAEANIIMIKEAEIGPKIKILEKIKSGGEAQIIGVIQHLPRARDAAVKEEVIEIEITAEENVMVVKEIESTAVAKITKGKLNQ